MSAEHRRLTVALLLSLLFHILLLSLTFGGQGSGLPGFSFPWKERRIEVPDLHVVLMPVQVAASMPAAALAEEPLQQTATELTVAAEPALKPAESTAPPLSQTAEVTLPEVSLPKVILPKATAPAEPAPNVATGAVPAKAPVPTEVSGGAVPTPIPEPEVIAMERPDEATWDVPPPAPKPVIADVPSVLSPETVAPTPPVAGEVTQKPAEPAVRERAVEVTKPDPAAHEAQRQADQLEAARVAAARLEAQRREAAQQEAAQLEAQRQEAARQETSRVEAARLEVQRREAMRQATATLEAQRQEVVRQDAIRVEAARQEATRQAAAQQEAQRQEAARVEAARLEAQRQEAARQAAGRQGAQREEAARQEAASIEAARLAAAQQEAARVLAEQEAEARREARLRAIGRQLDEEAAQRKAASRSTLPYSLSTARRVRLWGRTDPNVELVHYAEAWARKIQFNTPVDTVRDVAKRPHIDPLVTVAIRSDGSVESVTFVLSSGVAEVDEAIRLIVQSHVRYQAFPPGLAREFDVVEVRRIWHFDTAIRLE